MPTTRTGPSQLPIPNTTSPRLQNIYLRQRAVLPSCSPLKQRSVSRAGGWGGNGHKPLPGPGHGNVYVSRRSPLPSLPCHPSEVMHDLPPAQRSSFSKVDFWSVEQKTSASARSSTTLPSLQPRCAAEASGVFPSWDWIMYTIHSPSVRGRAAHACEHKSSLFGDEELTTGGREERSQELHLLSVGGAPSFIKLVYLIFMSRFSWHLCTYSCWGRLIYPYRTWRKAAASTRVQQSKLHITVILKVPIFSKSGLDLNNMSLNKR